MNSQDARTGETSRAVPPLSLLIGLAVALVCAYAAVAALSFRFAPGLEPTGRPIPAVLGLLGFAFVCYLVAIRVALRVGLGAKLSAVILLTSVLIRAVSLVSWPILEIDIYRYIWDGAVGVEGANPYHYSPNQVLSNAPDGQLPDELRRLVDLRAENAALDTILARVHYGELPTIYPPTSQAVFALAVLATPAGAGVFAHVVVMKTVFVLFDLATVVVVIGLLRLSGKHVGWSIAYGWCPLVVKEFANSGHLDSLAVFLTTLALYIALKPLAGGARGRAGGATATLTAVLLALAVGAKLYPIVLLPLFVAIWIRTRGWRSATIATASFLVVATIVLWPMLPGRHEECPTDSGQAVARRDAVPPPVDTAELEPQDPGGGLVAFLRRWEMNDFLFLIVVENLKPAAGVEPARRPWFSIVPENLRTTRVSIPSRRLELSASEAAFVLARAGTGIVFVLIAGSLLWRARASGDPAAWLRVAFLTLAWFWLLAPTQNPWYWIWAIPLVMFGGSRAWLAVSGLTMMYYLRFWLVGNWPEEPLFGTAYAGAAFFDFVVTWIEFGPWLLWLGWETGCRPMLDPVRENIKMVNHEYKRRRHTR